MSQVLCYINITQLSNCGTSESISLSHSSPVVQLQITLMIT